MISLQPGEEAVTVAAGGTVRWIVGDTSPAAIVVDLRIHVLVKPIRVEDEFGHHHLPPHVPAGTDIDRPLLSGIGFLPSA